jgi:putative ABC transport system ATP-binding protein
MSGDLRVRDLVVEFESGGYAVRPLDGFGMSLDDGSLAVLLGPSGCGKTTLLSCLGGILTPKSGSIVHGDIDVATLSKKELAEYRLHGVGIVFQAFNLVPSLTALQNVMAPLQAGKVSHSDAHDRAVELLTRVGLEDRMHHRPGSMSGGQQQRVSLARAIAHDPPLVIADEPTANLDYIQVETVLQVLRELAEPGRIVVVATHDDRLVPLADEVVEMVPAFREDGVPVVTEELEDGEDLFVQGARGTRVYVIESGEIEILRELTGGEEDLLAVLTAGEYFGEMGPLFGISRSATARARGKTVVKGYTAEQFRQLVGVESLTDLIRGPVQIES